METILVHAQALVYTLLGLMPTAYQRDSLQALLGLFLEAQGHPLPEHSTIKSAAALSRFLNHYDWSTSGVIRTVRQQIRNPTAPACLLLPEVVVCLFLIHLEQARPLLQSFGLDLQWAGSKT